MFEHGCACIDSQLNMAEASPPILISVIQMHTCDSHHCSWQSWCEWCGHLGCCGHCGHLGCWGQRGQQGLGDKDSLDNVEIKEDVDGEDRAGVNVDDGGRGLSGWPQMARTAQIARTAWLARDSSGKWHPLGCLRYHYLVPVVAVVPVEPGPFTVVIL